jgi:Flp pilus assembly pilin Flp
LGFFFLDPAQAFLPQQESAKARRRWSMTILAELWGDDQGQDLAEYAVMFAAILVVVIGTVRLVGSNANNVFSAVASSVQ